MSLRTTTFETLEEGSLAGWRGSVFRSGMVALVLVSTWCLVQLNDAKDKPVLVELCMAINSLTLLAFLLEYGLRIWSCPEDLKYRELPPYQARLAYVASGFGLIDFLAFVPLLLMIAYPANSRLVLAIGLLRCAKLLRYSAALRILIATLVKERAALTAAIAVIAGVATIAGGLISALEAHGQPDQYGSISASIWWAVETIVGSSTDDASPSTGAGRAVAALLTIFGFMMLAVPVGIIGASFENSFRQKDFTVTAGMVARVSLFSRCRPDEIVTIASALRSRKFGTGDIVVRQGDIGNEMFFILDGKVAIANADGNFTLAKGDYFGERALIRTEPRNSTVTALEPTRLLALDKTTLFQLIQQRPELQSELDRTVGARENAAPSPLS